MTTTSVASASPSSLDAATTSSTPTRTGYRRNEMGIMNAMQRPVWIFDVNRFEMFWANTAALSMWGASTLEELLVRDFHQGTTEATKRRMMDGWEKLQKGEPHKEQWTIYPNGKAKTIQIHYSCIWVHGDDDEVGAEPRAAAFAEAELLGDQVQESTTRGLELIRHLPVTVCEFALDGTPIFRNSEDLKLRDSRTLDDNDVVAGESVDASYATEEKEEEKTYERTTTANHFVDRFVDLDLGRSLLQKVQNQPQDTIFETNIEAELWMKDGTTRWFSVALRTAKDPISGDTVVIYSGRDITEIIQARLDTSEAKRKLDYLQVLAHELRTPLHQIVGFADLLDLTTLADEQKEPVQLIQKSSFSLIAIINDLVDYQSYEKEGKISIAQHPFSFPDFLQACAASIQPKMAENQLSFHLDISNEILPKRVTGDPRKIRRILLHLLENAVKFTPSGGSVTFRVTPSLIEGTTQWCSFHVEDTGIGIAPEHQGLIFEQYQQANMANTRSYDGTGLGLSITKRLSEAMGGKLGVVSELGEGAVFTVELPLEIIQDDIIGGPDQHPNNPQQPLDSSLRFMMPEKSLTVLIVEDNAVNQKMAKRMMERMGHAAVVAENGQIALDILDSPEYESVIDLVLMDIHMPVMDGIEATQEIRRRGCSKGHLPIVGLTASFQPSDMNYFLQIGMNTCLGKPIRLATIKKTFEAVTNRCASGMYLDSD